MFDLNKRDVRIDLLKGGLKYEVQHSAAFHNGGPRAAAIRGGRVDSPIGSRIFFTVQASLMKAMIRNWLGQIGQLSGRISEGVDVFR